MTVEETFGEASCSKLNCTQREEAEGLNTVHIAPTAVPMNIKAIDAHTKARPSYQRQEQDLGQPGLTMGTLGKTWCKVRS